MIVAQITDTHVKRKGKLLHHMINTAKRPAAADRLDSVIDQQAGGTLDEARLRWLSDTLGQAPGKPTLLFVHHPPFRTGIEAMDAMDAIGFHECERFGDYQFVLELRAGERLGIAREPPGFALHIWDDALSFR